ncbi:DUF1737 domain-containing protein [Nocardia sp. BMG51109]|uniref:DUF1737 domain-containing protein n=1 Tax=Nocardia sp. BMG51109 TaxID=1056816 RepID=UPI00046540CD|nr:DUF1737 domain-containing protein [Nocardia sp. BMG51109]
MEHSEGRAPAERGDGAWTTQDAWLTPRPGIPHYRFIAGVPGKSDWAHFERLVNELLADGYELYGHPVMTFNGMDHLAGQALVKWPTGGE